MALTIIVIVVVVVVVVIAGIIVITMAPTIGISSKTLAVGEPAKY